MPVPRKLWLMPGGEFRKLRAKNAAEQCQSRVNFGLRRACPMAENGTVHVHRSGLNTNRMATPELATTKAHFRDPLIVSSSDA